MGQIVDLSRMYIRNDDLDYDLVTEIHQDVSDDIQECNRLKNLPGNGFWTGRKGRHIGHIPNVAYLKALQDGYGLECDDPEIRTKEMRRYLNDYPQYRTVNYINTPGHTGKVIIK